MSSISSNLPRNDKVSLVRLSESSSPSSNSDKIEFRNQDFSDDDIEKLVLPKLLSYGEALRFMSVDLSYNQITARGVALLTKVEHLVDLDISYNKIGDEGGIILSKTETIRKLEANGCNIGKRGAEAFLENSSIEEGLFLLGDRISKDFDKSFPMNGFEKRKEWSEQLNKHLENNKARNNPQFAQELEAKRKKEIIEKQIMDAIEKEDIALLKILIPDLEEGVNTRLDYGCNLLTYALDQKSTVCVEALLKMGARIEDHEREYTPLFTAAENGDLNMVQLLLTYGSNITGEFYFNNETALSTAAFEFCQIFQSLLSKVMPDFSPEGKEYAEQIREHWEALSFSKLSKWQLFSQENSQEYACDCLAVFEAISEKTPHLIDEQLRQFAEIFRLINAKFQTIKEKAPSTDEDGYSTDEDISLTLTHRIEPVVKLADQFQDLTIEQLAEHINRLNQELKTGKTEETIDWSTYPRFFIAQFRGIHYYRHHFSKNQRADHRLTSHLNRIAPAPAAYFMSSLTPKEHQLARESTMKADAKEIRDTFEQLAESGKVSQYWGRKKHEFENQSDMMQQRMSGSYGGYMREIAKPVEPATQLLFDRGIRKGYPHYATSDLPRDALRYTFGQKPIEGLTEWRLRPRFQINGKASHPYPGKIFVTMFTPFQMHLHRTRHVGGMHNRGKIQLPSTVAPERETSIPGEVDAEISVYEELGVIPSFMEYHPTYLEKYGISEEKFKKYKQDISSSLTEKDSSKRDKIRKRVKNQIIDSIIKHKEYQLLQFALNEAKRLGGHLIFRHFDGEYGLAFEKMWKPTKKSYSYTKREEALLAFLDEERRLQLDSNIGKRASGKSTSLLSNNLDQLSIAYRELVDKAQTGKLTMDEILIFQDQVTQVAPSVESSEQRIYDQIVKSTEVLVVSILESKVKAQAFESASSREVFNLHLTFQHDLQEYVVRHTLGDGACAIHALLGVDVGGIIQFQRSNSSASPKRHYTDTLKAQLKLKNPVIQEHFINTLTDYFAVMGGDRCARMLFTDTPEGRELKLQWDQLDRDYTANINANKVAEGKLWIPYITKGSSLLEEIMKTVQAITERGVKDSPWYNKSEEEVIKMVNNEPQLLSTIVASDPSTYLAILESAGESTKASIKRAINGRAILNHEMKEAKGGLILSPAVVNHYVTTSNKPAFYFNTSEIHIAAHLFNKKVQVVASRPSGIEPSELLMNDGASSDLIVIHHQGAHFSRCVKS